MLGDDNKVCDECGTTTCWCRTMARHTNGVPVFEGTCMYGENPYNMRVVVRSEEVPTKQLLVEVQLFEEDVWKVIGDKERKLGFPFDELYDAAMNTAIIQLSKELRGKLQE